MNVALPHSKLQLELYNYLVLLRLHYWVVSVPFHHYFILIHGGGVLFYMHSDMTMRMFGTMQKCTHTYTHTRAPILVCEAWTVHCTRYCLLTERWRNDTEFSCTMSTWARPQSAILFSFCLLFAWAEKSNVRRSCLSLGFGWWERVIVAPKHTQRQLGLSTASTAVSTSAFYRRDIGLMLCRMTYSWSDLLGFQQ